MEQDSNDSNSSSSGLFGINQDYLEPYLSLDELLIKNRESTYFIRAEGWAMSPAILPGDILVVDRSLTLRSGQIIAFFLQGERMFKRYKKFGDNIELISDNPKFRTIKITPEMEFTLFGVVTALVREHKN